MLPGDAVFVRARTCHEVVIIPIKEDRKINIRNRISRQFLLY